LADIKSFAVTQHQTEKSWLFARKNLLFIDKKNFGALTTQNLQKTSKELVMKSIKTLCLLMVLSASLSGCDLQSMCEALGKSALTCALLF